MIPPGSFSREGNSAMADGPIRRRFFTNSLPPVSAGLLAVSAWLAAIAAEEPAALVRKLPLSELRATVAAKGRTIQSFELEGRVCAASQRTGMVALQDDSATELLELPSLPAGLHPGSRLIIRSSNGMITRGALAIQLGTAPVVEIDAQHSAIQRSGATFLQEGMQPIRVEWFNAAGEFALGIEYERPGMPRQKIPASSLWHDGPDQGQALPGLEYATYAGSDWHMLPDFSRLQPETRGVVPDFDPGVCKRTGDTGAVFTGYLKVPATGQYDFHLNSDDGARVFIGSPVIECSMISDGEAPGLLSSSEGTITFAAAGSGGRLELELTESSNPIHVTVADGSDVQPETLLRKRVKISGIRRAAGLVAIDATQIQMMAEQPEKENVLTEASQIRHLRPEEANKPYRAEIEGVVTMSSPQYLVVQDVTGGVYVHYTCPNAGDCPQPGELWRVEGNTNPGDFSPVILADRAVFLGNSVLPVAMRPTREQLANGSLDAEEVEIEGVVMAISKGEMKLLTRDGEVRILDQGSYPLPIMTLSVEQRASLPGSVVRLRGVYTASWDSSTGRVHPAELRLGNAIMSVDDPAPRAPFLAPSIRASDLLLFTSQSSALKRVKVSGTLLHARPPEFLLYDGTKGFRVVCRDPPHLNPGDQVEAVGFPRLGGPSPVLLEAQARKTGTAPLPPPVVVPSDKLPDARLDSTLVQIEATLLSDTVKREERVLEMRSGSSRFVALLPSGEPAPKLLDRDSVLRLTGVYVSATADGALVNPDPFEMRLFSPANIEIIRPGPWWKTRYTVAIIALLSGGLILASFWVTLLRRTVAKRSRELALEIEERESVERHRVMEQERSRVAQDLHDELGSGLTEAGILTSLVKNPAIPQDKKDHYLEQLNELCCTLVTGLDEIVWAVNPRYDSAADLAGYFSLFAQRFLGLAGIHCRLKIDDTIPEHPLDARMRHGIFLAFKEALNNIVRHSRANEVHLVIETENGDLTISLADDGSGFDRSTASPGSDGLHGMEERIRQLGGECTIESAPETGTIIRFNIPLERTHP